MPLNDAVDGGEEPAKSPMIGQTSILGANALRQTRRLRLNDDGQLEVIVVADQTGEVPNVSVLQTGVVNSIADSTPTFIFTYVSPGTIRISKVSVSGDGAADFELRLNTVIIEVVSIDTGALNNSIEYAHPLLLGQNDILEVRVTHFSIGQLRSFRSTLYGA